MAGGDLEVPGAPSYEKGHAGKGPQIHWENTDVREHLSGSDETGPP